MQYLNLFLLGLLSFFGIVSGQTTNRIKLPIEGEVLEAGTPFFISWDPTTSGFISLTLRRGNETNNETVGVIAMGIANTGGYTWPINSTTPAGDNYTIQLSVDNASVPNDSISPQFIIEANVGSNIAVTTSTEITPAMQPTSTISNGVPSTGLPVPTTITGGSQRNSTNFTSVKSTSTGSPPHTSDDRIRQNAIIGGTIGFVVTLLFIAAAYIFMRAPRRRRSTRGEDNNDDCRTYTLRKRRWLRFPKSKPGIDRQPIVPQENLSPEDMKSGSINNYHEPPLKTLHATVQGPESLSRGTRATSNVVQTASSQFTNGRPFSSGSGLLGSLEAFADEFYPLLEQLTNPGFALGLDILPRDAILSHSSHEKYFTGSREMLWIEYDASQPMKREHVIEIVRAIAEGIGHPVTAFGRGEFSIRLSHDPSTKESFELGNYVDAEDGAQDGSNVINSSGGNNDPGTPSQQEQYSAGSSKDGEKGKVGGDGDRDEAYQGHPQDISPNRDRNKENKQYETFTGKLKLWLNDSVSQQIKTSFGLMVRPSPGRNSAECHVALSSIVILVSEFLSADQVKNKAPQSSQKEEPWYATEELQITLTTVEGDCATPKNVHPKKDFYIDRVIKCINTQCGVGLAAALSPGGNLNWQQGRTISKEYKPVTDSYSPERVGSALDDGIQWRYHVHQDCASLLEVDPAHEVTFEFYYPRPPECIDVMVSAVFRRQGRFHSIIKNSLLSPLLRIRRDVQLFHLVTQLKVRLLATGNECFEFPGGDKKGAYVPLDAKLAEIKLEPRSKTSDSFPESTWTVGRQSDMQ